MRQGMICYVTLNRKGRLAYEVCCCLTPTKPFLPCTYSSTAVLASDKWSEPVTANFPCWQEPSDEWFNSVTDVHVCGLFSRWTVAWLTMAGLFKCCSFLPFLIYSGFRFIGPHPFETILTQLIGWPYILSEVWLLRHCNTYPFLFLTKWTNYVADPFNWWPH